MIATTASVFVLLCLYSSESSARSSSSNTYYTAPICGDNNFYCVGGSSTYSCLPRTQRCTLDGACNQCTQKTCQHCEYDAAEEKFRVYRYSTDLESFRSSGRKRDLPRLEHQFITYRGLMYEFGDYGTRVQDPNDPNYEYGPGRRVARDPTYLGLSSCTHEQAKQYLTAWTNYDLFSHNCQDFAKGLGIYLTSDCRGERRKRQSDEDFARYIFSIAGTNCTSSFTSTGSQPVVPLPLIFIAAGMLAFML